VTKSRSVRWVGHIERMGRGKIYAKFWPENLRGVCHMEDLCEVRRIILRWILRKEGMRV